MVNGLLLYVFMTVVYPAWAGTNKVWKYLALLIGAIVLDGVLSDVSAKDVAAGFMVFGFLVWQWLIHLFK